MEMPIVYLGCATKKNSIITFENGTAAPSFSTEVQKGSIIEHYARTKYPCSVHRSTATKHHQVRNIFRTMNTLHQSIDRKIFQHFHFAMNCK